MLSGKKVLLTGLTGRIGAAIAERFAGSCELWGLARYSRAGSLEEARKLGLKPLIPPLAPFHNQGWPWHTDPGEGSGPKSLREALKDKNPDGTP